MQGVAVTLRVASAEADDEPPPELNHPIDIAHSLYDAYHVPINYQLISPTHAIKSMHPTLVAIVISRFSPYYLYSLSL